MTNFIELTNLENNLKCLVNVASIDRVIGNNGVTVYFSTLHPGSYLSMSVAESYEDIKKALIN